MVETAAWLVDAVIPEVPVRQWVLSLPYRVRVACAFDADACALVRRVLVRTVSGFYGRRRHATGLGALHGVSCRTMSSTPGQVTLLLRRCSEGDTTAASELFAQLYQDLRARARHVAGRADATLQPTALVHEAWLKLVPEKTPSFADRCHFLRAAAAAMRSVLVDHIREQKARKRGGDQRRVELDAIAELYDRRAVDLLSLDDALRRLGELDAQLQQVVELRFFAGLQMQEIGPLLGVSTSSVERAWRTASAWLRAELGER